MKTARTTARLAMALMAGALISGCIVIGDDSRRSELDEARTRWEAAGLSRYEFQSRKSCFCGPEEVIAPVVVLVDNGAIAGVRLANDGTPVDPTLYGAYDTVEELFDKIESAIDQDAEELTVTYDPTYGYPLYLSVDISSNIADEEYTVEASGMRPL